MLYKKPRLFDRKNIYKVISELSGSVSKLCLAKIEANTLVVYAKKHVFGHPKHDLLVPR